MSQQDFPLLTSAHSQGEWASQRILGNPELAVKYLPLASMLLGIVKNSMGIAGIDYGHRLVKLRNGATIRVIRNIDYNIVEIDVQHVAGDEDERECFPYVSGVYDYAMSNVWQFYPARETLAGIERKWYQYSRNSNFTLWPLTNPNAEDVETQFIIRELLPCEPPRTGHRPSTRFPSQYTGKLRHVAQKLHGRGFTNPFHYDCGLFIPSIVTRNHWIIDIRSDGVFVYPIRLVDESQFMTGKERTEYDALTEEGKDRYRYGLRKEFTIPNGTVVTSLTEWDELDSRSNALIKYLDEPVLSSLFSGLFRLSTWYNIWAFDYTGHKACAVLIGTTPDNKFYYSYLFEMVVAEDDAGRPSGVQINIIKEGILRTWTLTSKPGPLSYHALKAYFPTFGLASPVLFDVPGTWHSEQPNRRAPVYAFYNRLSEMVLLEHVYEAEDYDKDEWFSPLVPSTMVSVPRLPPYSGPIYSTGLPSALGLTYYKSQIAKDFGGYLITIGTDDPLGSNMNTESYTYASRHHTGLVGPHTDGFQCGGFVDGFSYCQSFASYYYFRIRDDYNAIEQQFQSIAIPAREREGLFFYEHLKKLMSNRNINHMYVRGPTFYTGKGLKRDSSFNTVGTFATTRHSFVRCDPPIKPSLLDLIQLVTIFQDLNRTDTEISNQVHYYIGSIKDRLSDLPIFPDADTWFDDRFQLYESGNGAYTGDFFAAPYSPGPAYWKYTADYPLDTSYAWRVSTGLVRFPAMAFIGDDSTDLKLGCVDLEAVSY